MSARKKSSNAVAVQKPIKTVLVNFQNGSGPYTYKSDLDVQPEDKVIVDSPNGGLQVAVVYAVDSSYQATDNSIKWIVDIVDTTEYQRKLEIEAQRRELEAKLKARMAELDESQKMEIYAKNDKTFRDLLNQYKTLA